MGQAAWRGRGDPGCGGLARRVPQGCWRRGPWWQMRGGARGRGGQSGAAGRRAPPVRKERLDLCVTQSSRPQPAEVRRRQTQRACAHLADETPLNPRPLLKVKPPHLCLHALRQGIDLQQAVRASRAQHSVCPRLPGGNAKGSSLTSAPWSSTSSSDDCPEATGVRRRLDLEGRAAESVASATASRARFTPWLGPPRDPASPE